MHSTSSSAPDAKLSGPKLSHSQPTPQPGPSDHTLAARAVRLGYGDRTIVPELSAEIPRGKFTIIIGSNACGKSTLLRGLSRLLKPQAGEVLLDGKSIQQQSTKAVARVLGLLPQHPIAPDGIRVSDLVSRGRYPHQGWFKTWTPEDDQIVADALAATGTDDLAARNVDELSGGQRQRVWIAMALAQRTDLLLLDEPTTYLDLNHQVEVLDVLRDLNHERGTTVVVVMHDLNLAARYADHLIAMKDGRIVAEGTASEVITREVIREVFSMESQILTDPLSGTPLIVPVGRHHCERAQETLG
ncbi:ABC transporter ATP-binding protein [Micrococcales bacterium 31B]|nr:ABC transporter ATP-binding protein [Micrococcales bacterium 31B]